MKIFLLFLSLALAGCNDTVKSVESAESFCSKHGGVTYYHHLNLVICKDGTVVRGT
jgi:hypothetical protein